MTGYLLGWSVPVEKKWFSQTIHTCKASVVYLCVCVGGGGVRYSLNHISPLVVYLCVCVGGGGIIV